MFVAASTKHIHTCVYYKHTNSRHCVVAILHFQGCIRRNLCTSMVSVLLLLLLLLLLILLLLLAGFERLCTYVFVKRYFYAPLLMAWRSVGFRCLSEFVCDVGMAYIVGVWLIFSREFFYKFRSAEILYHTKDSKRVNTYVCSYVHTMYVCVNIMKRECRECLFFAQECKVCMYLYVTSRCMDQICLWYE